jgi:hypothetical protein
VRPFIPGSNREAANRAARAKLNTPLSADEIAESDWGEVIALLDENGWDYVGQPEGNLVPYYMGSDPQAIHAVLSALGPT